MDLGGQIHGVLMLLCRAVLCWWRAELQVRQRESRIPPNKACCEAFEPDFSNRSWLSVVLLLPAVVLPWRKPRAAMEKALDGFLNKVRSRIWSCWIFLFLSPLARGRSRSFDGGMVFKERRRICVASAVCGAVLLCISSVAMVVDGGCGVAAGGGLRWLWSDEAYNCSSSSLQVRVGLRNWLVCSSSCSTSDGRPCRSQLLLRFMSTSTQVAMSPRRCTTTASLASPCCSTVGKEKDSTVIFHLLIWSFLLMSGAYVCFLHFLGSSVKSVYTHCME